MGLSGVSVAIKRNVVAKLGDSPINDCILVLFGRLPTRFDIGEAHSGKA
jgi:hypothetical protein